MVAVYGIYPTSVLPNFDCSLAQGLRRLWGLPYRTQCTAGSSVWCAATWIGTDVSQFKFYVQMFGQL